MRGYRSKVQVYFEGHEKLNAISEYINFISKKLTIKPRTLIVTDHYCLKHAGF